ncbi:MAG: tubulin-like doman-containing protein [Geitlerinemataceae cyanobacterium]
MAVDEKTMVPTVIVGIGGTGNEVIARVRRAIEEVYGSLKAFPVVSFLSIDTDKDYQVSNPSAAGSTLKDNEKYHATVKGIEADAILQNMGNYPWIEAWFPKELEKNVTALEAGAGQIRGCGRFAFFYNYPGIEKTFTQACNRAKGHEQFMLNNYDVKVKPTAMNVFVVGSLSGGTGSGMILDLAYCIRAWLRKVTTSPTTTSIVPMPNAFASIDVGDRVLANGYAALMELSYFSDSRTEYRAQFTSSAAGEIIEQRAPFDFTYLVGTKNEAGELDLDSIREAIAQNIFLDLTSDFAPHKRSIRDNIKGSWAQADPCGRSYPKNFMSFGLSTVEIPISQIRASLSERLSADLVGWWLNGDMALPADMRSEVEKEILKPMRLTSMELLADLSSSGKGSLLETVSSWVNTVRQDIADNDRLKCTKEGLNLFGSEEGAIRNFVDTFLDPSARKYRDEHFNDSSPDDRMHGDYLIKMYENRDRVIIQTRKSLEEKLYEILQDRNRGPKFAEQFLELCEQIIMNTEKIFKRQLDTWEQQQNVFQEAYAQKLQDIVYYRDRFGLTKQGKMEELCEEALQNLNESLKAIVQAKSRQLGQVVIARMKEHLEKLRSQYNRFVQKLRIARDGFAAAADEQANSADTLSVNGIKLYDRAVLNELYRDFVEQQSGSSETSQSPYEQGLNNLCSTMAESVLPELSGLWQENRNADRVFRLFDLQRLEDVQDEDVRGTIFDEARARITKAPQSSKLVRELSACDLLYKTYNNDNAEIRSQIAIAYGKSNPFLILSRPEMTRGDASFTPQLNQMAAIVNGRDTEEPAAQKLLEVLSERLGNKSSIAPLAKEERHRIVFVQEMGGFSLRCIEGMRELRKSYQDWQGQMVEAKRAQFRGEARDMPIPVHIQKDPPFWDVFPPDERVYQLVVLARVLEVLTVEFNKASKDNTICYQVQSATGDEKVEIASTWEEAVQLLEIDTCRRDREAVSAQVSRIFADAESDDAKRVLTDKLAEFLKMREAELPAGQDSPEYRRDRQIVKETIEKYGLPSIDADSASAPMPQPEATATPAAETSAPTPAPAAAPSSSLEDKLKELQKVRELGLISDEDFETRKKSILDEFLNL